MAKVKKAVIPAAGLGTRFLPATKTIPKEMLTIVDAPIIFYVVEEAMRAGIEDVVLVTGRGKHALEDFFDTSYEIEEKLHAEGKFKVLERLEVLRENVNIISVRQRRALGLGHAIYSARSVLGQEPFAVLLGDEIFPDTEGSANVTRSLIENFEKTGAHSVSLMKVPDEDVHKYGIADLAMGSKGAAQKITKLQEKPQLSQTDSRWALTGRYIFKNSLLGALSRVKAGVNNEIQLTDAMAELLKEEEFWGVPITNTRFDAGDKLGFLKANIEMALRKKELAQPLQEYILDLAQRLQR